MGMQLNVPDHQFQDRPAREHRVRLWWTAYILDRTCTSKIGLPVSVADDDIQVNLPSANEAESLDPIEFGDFEYELCSVGLSKITAMSTEQIYSRRDYHNAFSQRVQTILKALYKWMDELPARFHLRTDSSSSLQENHIVYLHLRFNQVCVPPSKQTES
jgi:proline utilization trans-activator